MENNRTSLEQIIRKLWTKRLKFIIIWIITFALSCLIILPQPRYYDCTVKLAPESGESSGGLATLASFVNLNIDGVSGGDAFYPMLYPDILTSPDFIVGLMKIQVSTYDGELTTDYYTYLNEHQKTNVITKPYNKTKAAVKRMLKPKDPHAKPNSASVSDIDPFDMSVRENDIANIISESKIKCNVDKKTDVITITVRDQDKKVCALLADSIKSHLQYFITDYRTMKAREDEKFFKALADSALAEYNKAILISSNYQDSHRKSNLQQIVDFGEQLRNDLETKLNIYNTFNAQYQAARTRVQERTPAFTTLKSASIPQKPAGPKRKFFILIMLFLATAGGIVFYAKEDIISFFNENKDNDQKPLFKIIEE